MSNEYCIADGDDYDSGKGSEELWQNMGVFLGFLDGFGFRSVLFVQTEGRFHQFAVGPTAVGVVLFETVIFTVPNEGAVQRYTGNFHLHASVFRAVLRQQLLFLMFFKGSS